MQSGKFGRIGENTLADASAWRKLTRSEFNCEADALAALAEFNRKWRYHTAQAQAAAVTRYAGPGRPGKHEQPEVIGYQLTGELEVDEHRMAQARGKLGRFLIATNQMDGEQLSAQQMLMHYTGQGISVERGFRFLKDPLFFADSLFLKKPGRIMALLMVMGLSLLVYSLAERHLRQQLQDTGETVPDQKKKPTQTPTMRWVFQLFEGIDLLLVWQGEQLLSRQVTNLREEHRTIIHLLGSSVEYCYLLPP